MLYWGGWVCINIFINLPEMGVSSMLMEFETADNSGHLVVPEIIAVPREGQK